MWDPVRISCDRLLQERDIEWRRRLPWLPACVVVFRYEQHRDGLSADELDDLVPGRIYALGWNNMRNAAYGIPDHRPHKTGAIAFERDTDAMLFMLSIDS